jgi:hypothetical protein
MRKIFNQSHWSSLLKYARNLSNIDLKRRTYVPIITSKFHKNSTIPSQDIVRKAKQTDRQTDRWTDGRTDREGDYYRAPASRCGALIKGNESSCFFYNVIKDWNAQRVEAKDSSTKLSFGQILKWVFFQSQYGKKYFMIIYLFLSFL